VTGEPPAPLPAASLQERIAAWDKAVAQIEAGYAFDLDDWLNDMDLRRLIEEAMAGRSPDSGLMNQAPADRLAAIDHRFRRATLEAGKCLWGKAVAVREGWHPDRHWWYFRRPRPGNAALDRDIDRVT